ncbi:MAG: hydantoinase/oxoprolinase family protein [Sphingomonadaceae bacterium]|uniref:hydantoinase/oxoprolinase family protein n=1 Tax=Thermaurantiacus sp. TaxID=2820283 RepID=UPI00298F0B12|nr:hydantoinase/oxoprolinase family protein [Thermaurantiacus sp.]MCS6987553.1 hydantoinase/oxoprolinase family protein [Sphingomonadaceae bacterium]MDW8415154.1 hydantoinase/oxoprolinase family protein [Thermaurantiacus sp.]
MSYRLGVDVGGTFTDLLVIDEETGATWREKVPSTPDDPSRAVIEGARSLCAKAGIGPDALSQFLHGTTVATNAVLEAKIARVGLVVTEGYRHILQIARSLVPGGLAAWIVWPKPEPMAPLEATIEVPERIGADGRIVRPLDEAALRRAIARLREERVEAVTVCLINAYVNPAHERRVGEILAEELPGVPVSLSSEILPEMQEYERALTTVANSAVRPTVARYVANLDRELKAWGTPARLHLLRSDGGLMTAEKSTQAPVNLLMSGPAGGVAGARWVARNAGLPNVLTLDMGGTSTDVALIENYEPRLRRETSVGHLTVRASSLDVRTVGAGGGSIATVPELTKALRVGPQSAGAVPGPAAYGRGGDQPTVTDANVVLGYLPENLLGGAFRLDREAARRAVQKIADALGLSLLEAAAGIVSIVNETMFGALRLVSVQQGYDPRDFALMAFGGAGPLHGNALGILMGSWPVVIPPSPGILCAYGDATTRLRVDAQRSFNRLVTATDETEVRALLAALEAEVVAELEAEGARRADIEVRAEIDVRYAGQAFEVPLAFPPGETLAGLAARFDAEHLRLFTFNLPLPQELVNVRVVALGKAAHVVAERIPKGDGDPTPARLRTQELWMDGRMQPAAIYDRARLRAGDRIPGPAIVCEMDSTTLVHSKHLATVDEFGNIRITPE